jgi:predicted ABC-type transport system involved in lysophospholipase L1 biosynthesis ATPase subunit
VTPILDAAGVVKDYRGLRPLRIAGLSIAPGESVAILGLDAPAGEVFVNLATGATLPDQGTIRLFDRRTDTFQDGADWLSMVDRFGIVSERAVLLDGLTVIQNLAIPFTLEIEPPAPDIAERAAALARDVGLVQGLWHGPVASLNGVDRVRVRLGRALALDPALIILEHPTAAVERAHVGMLARAVREAARRRNAATLTITADRPFASDVAARVLTLEPATGRLLEQRRWFGRRTAG